MNGDQDTNIAGAHSFASSTTPLTSSRPSPFTTTTTFTSAPTTMAASTFIPQSQTYRPTGNAYNMPNTTIPPPMGMPSVPMSTPMSATSMSMPMSLPMSLPMPAPMSTVQPYERAEFNKHNPVGTPFTTSALIRRLPVNTSEEQLRLMVVWAEDLIEVEVLPVEQSEDAGFRSAILKFRTSGGAQKARDMLDGKMNVSKDAAMIVEILSGTPNSSTRFGFDHASNPSSNASSAQPSRQPSRFNGTFQTIDKIAPPVSSVYSGNELPNPETSNHYQNLFSPQSPIGNHINELPRISGKSLITDDDETGELLKDPVAYAENGAGAGAAQRRPAAPQLPISRMGNLSLDTTAPVPPPGPASSIPPYSAHTMGSMSAHGVSMMSPAMSTGPGMQGYHGIPNMSNMGHGSNMGNVNHMNNANTAYRNNFPPVNPADQNPPCNTLYVGNLPVDTSEEELKAMFSKQRGYKRLCFRTKQNGPMCFVEFEDVSFATKALSDLYGQLLHNSVKGGIRLSFSKNPLGVRSGQNTAPPNAAMINGMNGGPMAGSGPGFTTASGPPPGLSAPPGLAMNRYHGAGIGSGAPANMPGGMYHAGAFANGNVNGNMHGNSHGPNGNLNSVPNGGSLNGMSNLNGNISGNHNGNPNGNGMPNNNTWNNPLYAGGGGGNMAPGGPSAMMNGLTPPYPAHMMGR